MTLYTFRVNRSVFTLNIEWYAYLCSNPIFMQRPSTFSACCVLFAECPTPIERGFGGPGYQRGGIILLSDGGYAVKPLPATIPPA